MSRIKRPMYCICRRLASWLLMRFASSTASSRSSASAIDLNCVSGSPTSATPSACSSCISRFLRVLLTISSCTRCYHSAPMPKRHGFSCDPGELRSLAQVVLERARHAGANGCDCDVSEAYGLTVTVRKGQPDTIEHNRDRSVGVSIYLGERTKVRRGHASTSDFSRAALEQTVDAALAIARHTAEDECAGLPDADLLAREQPDLDLFHPWDLSTEEAIETARRCEAAAFSVSKKIRNSEGATVAAHQSQFVFANSLGFVGGYPGSRHSISCSVIAEYKGLKQRDDWFSAARVPAKLAEPQALGRYHGQRRVARLATRKIATCQAPVLFEAPAALQLIGHFVSAVHGGNLYRKTSFRVERLGTQVVTQPIRTDRPPDDKHEMASTPFDEEIGRASCREREWGGGRAGA